MNQGSSHAKSPWQKQRPAHSSKEVKSVVRLQNKVAKVAGVEGVRGKVEGDEFMKRRMGRQVPPPNHAMLIIQEKVVSGVLSPKTTVTAGFYHATE